MINFLLIAHQEELEINNFQIDENTTVKNGRIAPGTTGYFDIEIDPTLVDVSFDYEITFDILNKDMPDLMISKYAILDKDYNLKMKQFEEMIK